MVSYKSCQGEHLLNSVRRSLITRSLSHHKNDILCRRRSTDVCFEFATYLVSRQNWKWIVALLTAPVIYSRGHQTTARGPNPAREAISSGPRRHFANEEKQYNKGKFVDMAETFPETITFCKMSGPRTVE